MSSNFIERCKVHNVNFIQQNSNTLHGDIKLDKILISTIEAINQEF